MPKFPRPFAISSPAFFDAFRIAGLARAIHLEGQPVSRGSDGATFLAHTCLCQAGPALGSARLSDQRTTSTSLAALPTSLLLTTAG